MSTTSLARRNKSATKYNQQLAKLIRWNYAVLPSLVFEQLVDRSAALIRQIKRELEIGGSFARVDSFARTKSPPKLRHANEEEREFIHRCWKEIRAGYGRTKRSRRIKQLLPSIVETVPTEAIARLFGITPGAINRYASDLGISLPSKEACDLLRQFIKSPLSATPGLTESEQQELIAIWRSMRDESGATKRIREDKLLDALNNQLPSSVFMAWFGIDRAALCYRRRALKLDGKPAASALSDFLKLSAPPRYSYLTETEQASLNDIWKREKRLQNKRTKARVTRVKARWNQRFKSLLSDYKGSKVERKSCRCCKAELYSSPDFFHKRRLSSDGLEEMCKICTWKANQRPVKKRLKPSRILSAAERKRAKSIVRQNAKLVPTLLLEKLLDVNSHHIHRIRTEVRVKLAQPASWKLYLKWMVAKEMPATRGLTPEEIQRLTIDWETERKSYHARVTEDDGRFQLQLEDLKSWRDQEENKAPSVSCGGHYCKKQNKQWPASTQFFRRHTRCTPDQRRCHACANLDQRIKVFFERRKEFADQSNS